jgi:hypothetical protein
LAIRSRLVPTVLRSATSAIPPGLRRLCPALVLLVDALDARF